MSRTLWAALVLFVTLLGLLAWSMKMPALPPPSTTVSNADDSAVRTTVTSFGRALRNVSLLAPDAAAQIAAQYGPYAAPELVATWQADPQQAPGRQTSSPWPEHIDVVSVTPAGTGYSVEGNVIEVTSGANDSLKPAAVYPVSLTVEQRGGSWVITSFSKGAYTPLPQPTAVTGYWECLPHKDRTGPQTDECALGIAIDQSDGYYAVDTSLMSTYPVDFSTGTKVRIQGIVTPANELSAIQKYDIDGIIRATSIQKI